MKQHMKSQLRMSKGRVLQMVGAATGNLREPKHVLLLRLLLHFFCRQRTIFGLNKHHNTFENTTSPGKFLSIHCATVLRQMAPSDIFGGFSLFH